MPNVANIDAGVSALEAFDKKFREYMTLNPRELEELLRKQAKELAENCFLLTPRAEKAVIAAKLESLGPQFKRAPQGFARKFAAKDQSVKDAVTKIRRQERRKAFKALGVIRRPNESMRAAHNRAAMNMPETYAKFVATAKLTLEEERKAALLYRSRAIGALASSWLAAMKALGSKMAASQHDRNQSRPLSSVQVSSGAHSNPFIHILNEANGMVKIAQQSGFVSAALIATIKNMQTYIDRKKREFATVFNPTGAP